MAATYITSSVDRSELARRQAAVARGEVKLLYVAPERLMMPGCLHLLTQVRLALFAIDEAHCISEWGHDFRPEYRELTRLRGLFPGVPRAAFTATATRRVQADIAVQLGLQAAASFRGSFDRPNLYYEVRPKGGNAYANLVAFLREHGDVAGVKMLDYGEVFLAAIRDYKREVGLRRTRRVSRWRREDVLQSETVSTTLDLFRAGHNLQTITEAHGIGVSAIQGHLA